MDKNRYKYNSNEYELPELNEVTLRFRLDLLKLNNSSRNNKEKDEGYTIHKKNLFERLNCCKGLNYDSDILNARKKELKQDMTTLMRKVDQTLNEVENNVKKYNEKRDELLKKKLTKKERIEEVKGDKSPKKEVIIEPATQLDRIRLLLSKEESSPSKTKSQVKISDRDQSNNKHIINSALRRNKHIFVKKKKVLIEQINKKGSEVKLPMINQRILNSNTPRPDSNNSINNFNNSSFSSQEEENDIHEYIINNNKLLVKKYILPKTEDNTILKSLNKSKVKLDKNHKMQLGDLINEGEISKLLDKSIRKQRSQDIIPTQHTDDTEFKKSPNHSKKLTQNHTSQVINMKKLSQNNNLPSKIVKKQNKFPSTNLQEREKIKKLLNNDFMKLEEISFKINTTLDSALELLYNNAIAYEN